MKHVNGATTSLGGLVTNGRRKVLKNSRKVVRQVVETWQDAHVSLAVDGEGSVNVSKLESKVASKLSADFLDLKALHTVSTVDTSNVNFDSSLAHSIVFVREKRSQKVNSSGQGWAS